MQRLTMLVCTALILGVPFAAAEAGSSSASDSPAQQSLFSTVSRLDADFFNSFNHCASPAQLQKHASYLVPNLEFYHDKGGVTWSRADYLANTRKHVCGQFRRELIAASLQVFQGLRCDRTRQAEVLLAEIRDVFWRSSVLDPLAPPGQPLGGHSRIQLRPPPD